MNQDNGDGVEGASLRDRATLASHEAPAGLRHSEGIPSAEDLWETLCYLGKWVERGLFCKTVTPTEALQCLAHYPGMPWNSRRWDVDHKPYAAAYYAKFPKTAAQAMSAGTAETAQQAQGEARQRGPKDAPKGGYHEG